VTSLKDLGSYVLYWPHLWTGTIVLANVAKVRLGDGLGDATGYGTGEGNGRGGSWTHGRGRGVLASQNGDGFGYGAGNYQGDGQCR
jgi:hypothetical protein